MATDALLPGGVVALTGEAADRLLARGNGDAALLYLALLRSGAAELSKAGRSLRWTGERLSAAWDVLSAAGLVPETPPTPAPPALAESEEPPEYRSEDIARELENDASSFPALVGEVQRQLGKVLSTADLKSLYTIYDYLALPAEVICLLVRWCVEEQERKYGAGRRPRMPQIRKEAFLWQRLGLTSVETADAYLQRQSAVNTRESQILRLIGVAGRSAVDGERKYIAAWVDMGFEDEAIRLAYERTVTKKQNMSWPYMNAILKKWHEKGLHTAAAVLAGDSAPRRAAAPSPAPARQEPGAIDRDVAWMREFLKKEKAGEGEKRDGV